MDGAEASGHFPNEIEGGIEMRKVVYGLNVSLDGFYADIHGSIDFTVPEKEVFRHFIGFEREVKVHLYGRKMYETMSYWKADHNFGPAELEYAKIWNKRPNVVFSRTLKSVASNDRLLRGDIAAEVKKLKKGPGKYMVVAGGEIASTFIKLGLIDEYRFYLRPIVLGNGKPMFQSLAKRLRLKLIDSETIGSQVVLLRYKNALG
ncbi:MAG TPA: dihydrofolate reductase family protein [bacterium]|nr:dihydrofolate reductase family protein [bacterium]